MIIVGELLRMAMQRKNFKLELENSTLPYDGGNVFVVDVVDSRVLRKD